MGWMDFVLPGVGQVVNSLQARSAAGNAADELRDGALESGQLYQDWINQFAPQLLEAAAQGGKSVVDAGEFAAGDVTASADRGVARMMDSNELLKSLFTSYMSDLDPYKQAGADAVGKLAAAGDEKFTFSQDDPSYQFRLNEGIKALERSAAARGTLAGGGTMKALTRYSQDVASTEYGKAFERFLAEKNLNTGILRDLVGVGSTANSQGLAATTSYGAGVSDNNRTASTLDLTGRQYAGDVRTGTTRYASDLNSDAVGKFVGLQADAGKYRADSRKDMAQANAWGHTARSNAWSDMIKGLTQVGNDWLNRPKAVQGAA